MIRCVLAALWMFLLVAPANAGDRVHHEAEVALSEDRKVIQITDTITVSGRGSLTLRVAPWVTITGVDIAGKRVRSHASRIKLPDTGKHTIRIDMLGTLPSLGDAGIGISDAGLYLPAGTGWLPDTDDGAVTYRIRVTTRAPWRAIATGWLDNETATADGHTAIISSRVAMEPPSLFAGPYTVNERQLPGLRLRTYFHAEAAPMADGYLDQAQAYLQKFSDAIGPYPYGDFHIVSAPLPVGLGFPSLTYVGRRVLPLPFMRGRSLAHEILHSWWGNAVGVDYATGNWAEGLTTYMADHALASDKAARDMRLGWLRDYAALPAERDKPARAFVSKRHRAAQVIGYNKVAMAFHMLRAEVGAETFDAAIRDFYKIHRYGQAGWRELQAAFSKAAGRDLGWFFTQWLDRAGAPRIELTAADVSTDGKSLILGLRQATPSFRLNVPVRIETPAGTVNHWLELNDVDQRFTLALDARPTRVQVDSEFGLFRRLLDGESPPILRDVALATKPVLAIVGGEESFRATAQALAKRLTDAPPRLLPAGQLPDGKAPALVIGLAAEMETIPKRLDLRAPPEGGTARAWASRPKGGAPIYAVAVRDEAALKALFRGLPHYGRRGYVVFDGRRAIDKGSWPASASPLSVDLK